MKNISTYSVGEFSDYLLEHFDPEVAAVFEKKQNFWIFLYEVIRKSNRKNG